MLRFIDPITQEEKTQNIHTCQFVLWKSLFQLPDSFLSSNYQLDLTNFLVLYDTEYIQITCSALRLTDGMPPPTILSNITLVFGVPPAGFS